jgi:hypothetical protein
MVSQDEKAKNFIHTAENNKLFKQLENQLEKLSNNQFFEKVDNLQDADLKKLDLFKKIFKKSKEKFKKE